MDADTSKLSINLAQHELDKSRADWSAEKLRRARMEAEVSWVYPAGSTKSDAAG